MRSTLNRVVLLLCCCTAPLSANDGKPRPPADFRLRVDLHDTNPEKGLSSELIAYQGRILEIVAGRPELVLIDPHARRMEILDLDRKRIARITFDRLDAETIAYKNRLQRTVDKLARSTRRAERLNAAKTRDLIAPQGEWAYNGTNHTLKRVGTNTEVEASGTPDQDAPRLELVRQALSYLVKLDIYRVPSKIPPFAQLQAIDLLTQQRRLRPTEMSFLYRLNGPPVRFRWNYELTPGLTAADIELWTKLDHFLNTATVMDLDTYDRPPRPPR